MKNIDIIKNADRIDCIYKTTINDLQSLEDLQEGKVNSIPVIRVVFFEEVEGNIGINIRFGSEESRDQQFDEMAKSLEARLFSGNNNT